MTGAAPSPIEAGQDRAAGLRADGLPRTSGRREGTAAYPARRDAAIRGGIAAYPYYCAHFEQMDAGGNVRGIGPHDLAYIQGRRDGAAPALAVPQSATGIRQLLRRRLGRDRPGRIRRAMSRRLRRDAGARFYHWKGRNRLPPRRFEQRVERIRSK